jgi:hypothetical protein
MIARVDRSGTVVADPHELDAAVVGVAATGAVARS